MVDDGGDGGTHLRVIGEAQVFEACSPRESVRQRHCTCVCMCVYMYVCICMCMCM